VRSLEGRSSNWTLSARCLEAEGDGMLHAGNDLLSFEVDGLIERKFAEEKQNNEVGG